MRYEIKGGSFPVVICNLENGEKWLQTMPIYSIASAIRPFIPTGNP